MRSRQLSGAAALAVAAAFALSACSTGNASSGGASQTSAQPSAAASVTAGAVSSSAVSASAAASVPASAAALPSAAPSGESNAVQFQQATPGSGKGLKIGLIALDDAVPFSKLVSDSVQQQAARAGAQLVFCDSKGDGATALACAQTFKVEGVRGYLNFQSDAGVANSICAAGPKVPVIAIDIEQGSCQTAFMGANNQFAGELAGRALGTYMKKKFNCQYDAYVSMEEPDAGAVNTARMGGYRTGFESVCGPIKNLKVENAFRIDQARTTFADVLTTLPGLHRIIVAGINDDAIEGALAAAKTAGRVNDLYVSGQGADPSSWCDIKTDPQWVGGTAYFPERYGEIGVPYLIKAVKGQAVPKLLLVPHIIINAANIESIYHPSC